MTLDDKLRQYEASIARAAQEREVARYERNALQVERDYFRDIVRAAVERGVLPADLEEASLTALEWSDSEVTE